MSKSLQNKYWKDHFATVKDIALFSWYAFDQVWFWRIYDSIQKVIRSILWQLRQRKMLKKKIYNSSGDQTLQVHNLKFSLKNYFPTEKYNEHQVKKWFNNFRAPFFFFLVVEIPSAKL